MELLNLVRIRMSASAHHKKFQTTVSAWSRLATLTLAAAAAAEEEEEEEEEEERQQQQQTSVSRSARNCLPVIKYT